MPVDVRKLKKGGYRVSTPGGVKAKKTTKDKAEKQERLLNAIDHGWKPTGKPARESVSALAAKLVDRLLTEERPSNPDFSTRAMTPTDRLGYGGAADPGEGISPQIGEVEIEGIPGEVIADKDGIHVILSGSAAGDFEADDPQPQEWVLSTPWPQARAMLPMLGRAQSFADLTRLGFQRII